MAKERKFEFQPLKDYAALSAPDLLRDWLTLPVDNIQRFFVRQALRNNPNAIYQLSKKEQRQVELKKQREKRTFHLGEGEELIYVVNGRRPSPDSNLGTILGIILVPLVILAGLSLDLNLELILSDILAPMGILACILMFFLDVTEGIFGATIFLTSGRIGFCRNLFGKLKFCFSFTDLTGAVILAEIIYRERSEGILHIWRINEDTLSSCLLSPGPGRCFLEGLAAAVREAGGSFHAPAFPDTGGQKNWPFGRKAAARITGCDKQTLPAWYARARRALTAVPDTCHQQQLADLAAFIAAREQFHPGGPQYAELQRQLSGRVTFITRFSCRRGWYWEDEAGGQTISFSKGFICLTDWGVILADQKMAALKAAYPYTKVRLKLFPDHIRIYGRHNKEFLCKIYFFRQTRFPLIDTLELLGCLTPAEAETERDDLGWTTADINDALILYLGLDKVFMGVYTQKQFSKRFGKIKGRKMMDEIIRPLLAETGQLYIDRHLSFEDPESFHAARRQVFETMQERYPRLQERVLAALADYCLWDRK